VKTQSSRRLEPTKKLMPPSTSHFNWPPGGDIGCAEAMSTFPGNSAINVMTAVLNPVRRMMLLPSLAGYFSQSIVTTDLR
jgi:hypothetical protein